MPRVYASTAAREAARQAAQWQREDDAILARIGAYRQLTGKSLEEIGLLAGIKKGTMYNRMKNPGELTLSEYRRLMQVLGAGPEVSL